MFAGRVVSKYILAQTILANDGVLLNIDTMKIHVENKLNHKQTFGILIMQTFTIFPHCSTFQGYSLIKKDDCSKSITEKVFWFMKKGTIAYLVILIPRQIQKSNLFCFCLVVVYFQVLDTNLCLKEKQGEWEIKYPSAIWTAVRLWHLRNISILIRCGKFL